MQDKQQLTRHRPDDRQFVEGRGGRMMIQQEGRPLQVALPTNVMQGIATPEELFYLQRYIDAGAMANGDYSSAVLGGQPRGRFARVAGKMSVQTYAAYEVEAYNWLKSGALGKELTTAAEVIRRLETEELRANVIEWGAEIVGIVDTKIAAGAMLGSTRALCWALKIGYRDWAEFWDVRQRAAAQGRALTEGESVRRVRRTHTVRAAVQGHKPRTIEGGS
jgi:hypothetical protein